MHQNNQEIILSVNCCLSYWSGLGSSRLPVTLLYLANNLVLLSFVFLATNRTFNQWLLSQRWPKRSLQDGVVTARRCQYSAKDCLWRGEITLCHHCIAKSVFYNLTNTTDWWQWKLLTKSVVAHVSFWRISNLDLYEWIILIWLTFNAADQTVTFLL